MTRALTYRIAIAAAPETVWAALTTPEGSRATLYGSDIESDFAVGGSVEYVGHHDGVRVVYVYGEILALEPGRVFSYRHHPGPSHSPDHATTTCRMTYRVTPTGGGTELELTVDEWSAGNPGYTHAAESYPESDFLDGLKRYAESV
ncbi:hypothetical protein GCM10010441_38670 [Kitasatospora paracochleata]|uniref:Uncharacterized protein YndB with AHSA1/START domain n=1 Tax=Kitasatospora paracochleata TaxID=58354 RepID=A0ABT1IP94_9ACTN|nr:SRPBCC domain-containing protein [Kitasatospora paracochleata]MCP2306949.1 uncharacterized protein YndB with AHSA1/START domain [Kitasatospora paracochleata]